MYGLRLLKKYVAAKASYPRCTGEMCRKLLHSLTTLRIPGRITRFFSCFFLVFISFPIIFSHGPQLGVENVSDFAREFTPAELESIGMSPTEQTLFRLLQVRTSKYPHTCSIACMLIYHTNIYRHALTKCKTITSALVIPVAVFHYRELCFRKWAK